MAFPQIGLEAVLKTDQFTKAAREYTRTLDDMEKKTSRMASGIGKSTQQAGKDVFGLTDKFRQGAAGVDQGAKATEAAGLTVIKSFKEIGATAAIVTGAIAGVGMALNKALAAGEAAARLDDIRSSFEMLTASAGISATALLSEMQKLSRGTMTNAELMEAANNAILLSGGFLADKLPKMLQYASAAAKASGVDFKYAFDSLVLGVARGSPKVIDNARIMLKGGDALEKYAAAHNKLAADLSTSESQQATWNEVALGGEEMLQRMGGAAASATDPFKQFDAQMSAFSSGLKTVTLPATEWLTKSIGGLLTAVKYNIAAFAGWLNVVKNFGAVVKDPTIQAGLFKTKFDEVYQTLTTGTKAVNDAAGGIGEIGDAAEDNAAKVDELNKKLGELATQRADKLAKMALDTARKDQDVAIQHRRQMEDIARQTARQREDIDRNNGKAREKIAKDNEKRISEVEKDNRKRRQEFVAESQRAREDLERKHQENLYQINQKARDTISEAARRNDAVAIAEAMRSQQRELRDAQRNKGIEQQELKRDLTLKQQQLDADAALSLEKARQQNAEALAAQQDAEAEQEASLKLSLQRQDEDRRLSWARQSQDRALAMARQMADLDAWYAQEQAKLKEELGKLTAISVAGITSAGGAIGKAAADAISKVAASTLGWSADEQARQRGNVLGSETAPKLSDKDQWLKRHQFMAEGGVDIVNRPTHYVAGEAGPELAAFVPLRNNNLTIGGGVDVNVNGAGTGGMDSTAVQAMIYQAMTVVARRIAVTR